MKQILIIITAVITFASCEKANDYGSDTKCPQIVYKDSTAGYILTLADSTKVSVTKEFFDVKYIGGRYCK